MAYKSDKQIRAEAEELVQRNQERRKTQYQRKKERERANRLFTYALGLLILFLVWYFATHQHRP